MILKTVRVQNFKCVKDSTEFRIDEHITALVGKNESGKTALLEALYKLNPVEASEAAFADLEYPRTQWSEYRRRAATDPAPALTTTWELEPEDVSAVEAALGPAGCQIKAISISKGYNNQVTYGIDVDEAQVVQHFISEHQLMEDERASINELHTTRDVIAALTGVADPSHRQKTLLAALNPFTTRGVQGVAIDILHKRLPRFVYFSEYYRLPGQVALNDLKAKIKNNQLGTNHRVFLALLDLIGRTSDDIENISQFETLRAELEAASSHLTQEIFRYWSQNRQLRVIFSFDQARPGDPVPYNQGYILRTRIENTRHGSTTSFDARSAGFVWFFSFLVWFSQVRHNYGENLIILLDEPGHSLHAKAQADLLRYMEEELATKYQVLYTTHSPFMIDPSNLLRARTVEDVFIEPRPGEAVTRAAELGTKVGDDVLSTDRDTLFPLQAALGYEITQTLFLGQHTLLVEGPSDLLYLQWFQRKLTQLGRPSLDRRWTITPCGSVDKVAAFLTLFGGNRLHVAVLTDFAHGQKATVEKLRASKLLKAGHVFTADLFAGKAEADVEDILGDDMYVELVNRAFGLEDTLKLQAPSLPGTSTDRIVKRVEKYFDTLPVAVEAFSHLRPAEFLTQQGMELHIPGLEAAIQRFEELFSQLNPLL